MIITTNTDDLDALTNEWTRRTCSLNDRIDGEFRAAQDHAYALGLARGREDAIKQALVRIRATEVVDGESFAAMREAIAQRVADVAKSTGF